MGIRARPTGPARRGALARPWGRSGGGAGGPGAFAVAEDAVGAADVGQRLRQHLPRGQTRRGASRPFWCRPSPALAQSTTSEESFLSARRPPMIGSGGYHMLRSFRPEREREREREGERERERSGRESRKERERESEPERDSEPPAQSRRRPGRRKREGADSTFHQHYCRC